MVETSLLLMDRPPWLTVLSLGAAVTYAVQAIMLRPLLSASPASASPGPSLDPGDGSRSIFALMALAWTLHLATLAAAMLDTPARFGFAPVLSMTAWLMLTMYIIELRLYPRLRAMRGLCLLGAVTVVLAWMFPGKMSSPQQTTWLPLHLTLGVASYVLFAAAVVHAALMSHAERRIRTASEHHAGIPLLVLERLTFRFVMAGFVLLTATLVAGWWFGEALYKQHWVWNHKAVLSLLAWITFAVLLLGRRRFGWRGQRTVRIIYLGAALLLLAYVGSRFVLEVLLERPA